jgi:hypothetical protein
MWMNRPDDSRRGGQGVLGWATDKVKALMFLGAVAVFVLIVAGSGLISVKNPLDGIFGGGESDKSAKGEVIYEGQTAKSASERFLIEVGRGEAIVSVKAKQNWDTPGGPLSGDFQSTNGTSSVRDPENNDSPAKLALDVRYCSTGFVEVETEKQADGDSKTTKVTVNVDELVVCDVVLPMNERNAGAFHQDDTPDQFNREFVGFVAGAAEVAGKAAPCPDDQLAQFQTDEFNQHLRQEIAKSMGVDESIVDVKTGHVGESPKATKDELRSDLESYANKVDPDDPSKTFQGLDMTFLQNGEAAVEDACYLDAGAKPLEELEQFEPDFGQ